MPRRNSTINCTMNPFQRLVSVYIYICAYLFSFLYSHYFFVFTVHYSDQSAGSNLSFMSSSSQSVAKLSIKSNSEYIDMNRNLDDDLNAGADSPVSKKRKAACKTTGKTRGPASTAYSAAQAGHVYWAKVWLSHQPMIVQGSHSKCNFRINKIKCNMHTNMI